MTNGYLIDMDGVIYRGSESIPGAAEFIRFLQVEDTPYLFLTNNSSYMPLDVVHKLRKFHIETSEHHVYTAAMATAEFVHTQRPHGSAFVIGEGRVLNFELVEQAHRMIARGAKLLSTNSDTWCPTDSGPRPGCGAIVALLESASGEKAYHVGKPNPFMMRAARKRIGLRTEEVVLTGSSTRDSLKAYPFTPTRVVESIAELLPPASRSLVAELSIAFDVRRGAQLE